MPSEKGQFLLVTIDKESMPEEHSYEDKFVNSDTFEWVSQNRTKRSSPTGKAIRDHSKNGSDVHLFVRAKKKTLRGKASPFTYCGEVDFDQWEGDAPIKIRWKIRNALPAYLFEAFSKGT